MRSEPSRMASVPSALEGTAIRPPDEVAMGVDGKGHAMALSKDSASEAQQNDDMHKANKTAVMLEAGGSTRNTAITEHETPQEDSSELKDKVPGIAAVNDLKAAMISEHKAFPEEKSGALTEQSAEMLPSMDAASLMTKADDMMNGASFIIDMDFPFLCICNEMGKCDKDPTGGSCSKRPGSKDAARGLLVAAPATILLAAGLHLVL
eukprot:gnl/TRDRNA2_/TRDRNA2_161815_c0_seq1.p1 gnl/TRDRNA2_/TRDRNA2_161815_c0~~gnl/TRDRNA2_/TRDRNA2_161815_c0_seq1.p1  ORF type:complete len:207 (+),score=47.15 gnl/TRDRNA2_/TRDRNA2_161815_c0_seq1:236-856(+)